MMRATNLLLKPIDSRKHRYRRLGKRQPEARDSEIKWAAVLWQLAQLSPVTGLIFPNGAEILALTYFRAAR